MQFIFFIASTMLIVLISQQSTMGLPVNSTFVNKSCSKGFELIEGQCKPINSKLDDNKIESSSFTTEQMIIHEEKPAPVEIVPKRMGACPEGMEHGEHGICQKVKFSETTEATFNATADTDKNLESEQFPKKGCPDGTQPDEQGACQEIKPLNSTKIVTDPKLLLKKDGSCPINYKMVEGRCLFIKPKKNPKLNSNYLAADDNVRYGGRPKSVNDEGTKLESVPVLSDNSCPEGTEYSEYGLCQKRTRPLNSGVAIKADGRCPDNYELVNGKCAQKKSKVEKLLDLTNKISKPESPKPNPGRINNDKSTIEAPIVDEPHTELQSEATSAPLLEI
jgi:hypothetical protein